MNAHAAPSAYPIIVDSFAGGGGASTGIEQALAELVAEGVLPADHPDFVTIAINHDDAALAMHEANHPRTIHLPHNVWRVSLREEVGNRPIGLLWMSPDCRHHSKAKGGAPVSPSVRDLAWVAMRWLKELRPEQMPQFIFLENVEEFQKWGPTIDDGAGGQKPDKAREGETFKAWIRELKRLGYRHVEFREIRASTKGTPTIRKRLYVVASRNGPIPWPDATHADPKSDAVAGGAMQPWPVAADIIDWERPCPSIFLSKEEARAYTKATGTRLVRPLAHNTDARIAKGVKRYVLDAATPFVVTCNHGGDGFRGQGLDEPFATVTKARDAHGLVVPHVMTMRNAGKPHTAADGPVHTVTAGGAGLASVEATIAPFATYGQQGGLNRSLEDPHSTITASAKDTNAIAVPYLVPRYGERPGQEPRTRPIDAPAPTVVPTGNGGDLAAVYLAQHNEHRVGVAMKDPLPTVTTRGTQTHQVAAYIKRDFGCSVGHAATAPLGTVTADGQGKSGVVAAFVAQHNNDSRRVDGVNPGRPLDEPMATVTATGSQQGVIAAYMAQHNTRDIGYAASAPVSTVVGKGSTQGPVVALLSHAYTSNTAGGEGSPDKPLKTVLAGGNHASVVTLPMMTAYYSSGGQHAAVDAPMLTVPTKDRFGLTEAEAAPPPLSDAQIARARQVADFLRRHGCWDDREFVTVTIAGETWIVVDIGMRMLTARELARAQGFPDSYMLAAPFKGGVLSDTEQRHKIGNSVCPPVAKALVKAIYRPQLARPMAVPNAPLFLEAAE